MKSAAQVTGVARAFEAAVAGRAAGRELTRELRRLSPQGVTEGSLLIPRRLSDAAGAAIACERRLRFALIIE